MLPFPNLAALRGCVYVTERWTTNHIASLLITPLPARSVASGALLLLGMHRRSGVTMQAAAWPRGIGILLNLWFGVFAILMSGVQEERQLTHLESYPKIEWRSAFYLKERKRKLQKVG